MTNDGSEGGLHAFFYSDGPISDLGTFGGRDSFALGINDAGHVVGYAEHATRCNVAFMSQGGDRAMPLSGPDDETQLGCFSETYGINEQSEIVGQYRIGTGPFFGFRIDGSGFHDL